MGRAPKRRIMHVCSCICMPNANWASGAFFFPDLCDIFKGNPQQSLAGFNTAKKTIVNSTIWDQQKNYLAEWRWMSRKWFDLKFNPFGGAIRTRKFVSQAAVETKSNPRGDLHAAAETGSLSWEIMCKLFLRAFPAEEWLLESKVNCGESPKSWRQSLSSALTAHPRRGNTFWSSRATLLWWFYLPATFKQRQIFRVGCRLAFVPAACFPG